MSSYLYTYLTECHQFDNERQQCHNQLSQLDIISNDNAIPIHILLGEVDSVQLNKRKQVLAITGEYLRKIDNILKPANII